MIQFTTTLTYSNIGGAIDFLSIVGKAGIVLNPAKFQFAQRDVQFAGFHIAEDTVDPLPKYFDAIRNFPTPTSTTDIRSWFGLVNQVTNYAQVRDYMALFRPFPFSHHDACSHGMKISNKLSKGLKRTLSMQSDTALKYLI